MIKTKYNVPGVYYSLSRDFQLLGRLFDVVLNSVKTNADLIGEIPNIGEVDTKLTDLFMLSLGFKPKHNYDIIQLEAISKVFLTLVKNKGTLSAIEMAGNTILNAAGILGSIRCTVHGSKISIQVPAELTDTNLFYDILTYILPAGMSCVVVKTSVRDTAQETEIAVASQVNYQGHPEYTYGQLKEIDTDGEIKYNPAFLLDEKSYGNLAESTIIARASENTEEK